MKVLQYINQTEKLRAVILPGMTVLQTKPAPVMAAFTSRGPNVVDPNILKPDITAPGVNKLAAWTEEDSPTKLPEDPRFVKYNIISGTSMSCPHIAATAALVRAIHPTWSSAAIRSAIMTTAIQRNNLGLPLNDKDGSLANSFAYGSGHFHPTMAAYPSLVYDASYTDYLLYLCSIGIKNIDPSFKCPAKPPTATDLNYPFLAIPKLNGTVTVNRTVTNVGHPKSTYFFSTIPPSMVSVKAKPSILSFNYVGEKKSFTITITPRSEKRLKTRKINETEEYAFGWYSWTDGSHHVRSPITVSLA
ncbi:hypothetical protein TIFTF001_047588 [Ficus carica]|uniref:Uncharacterized protein n=1 Tax=Ficus carica TaxID=3494 RepID=A0AA87YV66_FICCA|nr:hypothetical protein TIFTF001_047588 [Ficus carica]